MFILYAWLTNLFYASCTIVAKLTSKHQLKNPWLLNFYWNLLTAILTIPLALYYGVTWPTHWGPLWVVGIFSMLAATLYILSLNLLDITILSPLYSFRTVFGVLLGVGLFNETLSAQQFGIIAFMFVASLFVSADETLSIKSFFRKTIGIAFLAVLMSATYSASIKYAMQYEGYWEVTLWGNVLTMVPLLLTVPFFKNDVKKVKPKNYLGATLFTILAFFGLLAANVAYRENISITNVIISVPLSMVLAFGFSVFAPKLLEKHTLKIYAIRFVAAAVVFIAAIKLTS